MPELSPTRLVLGYVLTAAVFLIVDLLWLGVVARGLYDRYLGPFLTDDINWTAALVFYALFIVGVLVFAAVLALERDSAGHALRVSFAGVHILRWLGGVVEGHASRRADRARPGGAASGFGSSRDYSSSKRSSFITFSQASAKSRTNASAAPW